MILITNDDGVSEGLKILLKSAKKIDSAYAVAPNRQRSAVSRALTLHKPIRHHFVENDLYTINGTPADCVLFSLYSGAVKKPDFVLSGINWGNNCCLGPMIGSGTIGACWMSILEGVPAIAFSVQRPGHDWRDSKNWGDSVELENLVGKILQELIPKASSNYIYNVNIPEDFESSEIVYVDKIQKQNYITVVEKRLDPSRVPYYWIHGVHKEPEKGTDLYELLVNKNIVISRFSLEMMQK